MKSWETGFSRAYMFAEVVPRSLRSARIAHIRDTRSGRPRSGWGPRAVGETVFDEFFIAINSVLRDIPADDAIAAYVDRCAAIADEFAALGVRGANEDPGPPQIISRESRRFMATPYEQLTFQVADPLPASVAAYDPGADDEAQARLLSHGGSRRRWLIWVHGASQGRPDDLFSFRAAHLHHNLDFELVLPVLPAHGPRGVPGVAYPGFDPILNVLITMRAVAEIRSLIGWIETHDPIDITIAGTSLGGPIAALVASLDPRVTSVLATVPMLDMHRTLTHHMARGGIRGKLMADLLSSEPVRTVSAVMDPLSVEPFAEPDRRMVIAALNDRITSVTAAQRLHQHWNGRVHWYQGSHVGSVFAGDVKAVADNFLLGRPSPPPA
ncbi:MAG: alpha/beta hydrolase family protein [Gordonia amarae]